jgi:6-phosphogluconolactonase (cycloisomerase 2 family)
MVRLLLTLGLLSTTLFSSPELNAWGCFSERKTNKETSTKQATKLSLDQTLTEAAPVIYAVTSANGALIASPNYNENTLSIYTTKPHTHTQWIAAGNKPTSVAYSPDDKCLAVANSGNTHAESSITLHYVSRKDGKLQRFQVLEAIQNPEVNNPTSVAYSRDGSLAAVAYHGLAADGSQSSVAIYKVLRLSGKWKLLQLHPTNNLGSAHVAFSPDKKFLTVSNYCANSISMYQINSDATEFAEVVGSPIAAGMSPLGLAYSHSGQFLAVCNSGDNTVTTYIVESSGMCVATGVQDIGTAPGFVTFSKDDLTLSVTTLQNGLVKIYDVDQITGALTFKNDNSATDSVLYPFGK